MKTQFIYFVICLTLVNCKEPQPELDFQHSNEPVVVNCEHNQSELFNEALYNFEANLTDYYSNENTSLSKAYSLFINESTRNKINLNNISNQHSLDIFKALKNIEGLWTMKDNKLSLNYNHQILKCIGDNIQDKDLKTTFNALLSTNSMNMRMLKDVLITKSSRFNTDKYLATFVALELYYSKLSDVDLSQKQERPTDNQEKDPHAGHNHD